MKLWFLLNYSKVFFISIELIHFFIIHLFHSSIHVGTEVGVWEAFIQGSVQHRILHPSLLCSSFHVANLYGLTCLQLPDQYGPLSSKRKKKKVRLECMFPDFPHIDLQWHSNVSFLKMIDYVMCLFPAIKFAWVLIMIPFCLFVSSYMVVIIYRCCQPWTLSSLLITITKSCPMC